MRFSTRTLVKVIVFSIVCLLFTVALGAKLANRRLFADTYLLQAEFEDAQGVLKGDAVKIAGVDVGRVEETQIQDGTAIVTFNVETERKIPEDSTLAIRWRNVVGQRFLYIYPGESQEMLSEGARIPASQTESAADIAEFLNRAGPVLKAIDPRDANAFLDAMNTALSGNEQQVRRLIDSGASLAQELGAKDDEISSLIRSSDEIMAAYASQEDQLGAFIDDLEDVSGFLERRTNEVNALVTNMADVQEELNEILQANGDNIDATLGHLETVTRTVANSRKDLTQTLETMPMGVAGYFQTTSWGEWFNVRITDLMVRDRDGRIIAHQSETDDQHGDKGGGPEGGSGGGERGGSSLPGVEDGAQDDRPGVESILRYVLTGRQG